MTPHVLRSFEEIPAYFRGGSLTIGNFDGVHRGHAVLIDHLRKAAEQVSGPAIVFTFDPHPLQLLRPHESPPPLTWIERKCELLAALGVSGICIYPTDRELLRLSAAEFFERVIVKKLQAKAMVEGPNFCFGRGREGKIETLTSLCSQQGLLLDVLPPVQVDGDWISSSRIRQLLLAGEVTSANAMLTAPYRLRGLVVEGAKRGRTLGFPTANITQAETLLPGTGVYAGRAFLNNNSWPAAIHVGPNPTFGEEARKLEAHLLGCQEDLYGTRLEVEFLQRLRDVHPFPSVDSLLKQLRLDVAEVERIVRDASRA